MRDLSDFELFLKSFLNDQVEKPSPRLNSFWEGLNYSLFSGGKRFRPMLSLMTAEALGEPAQKVFGFAAAVEMIHTYSLIHDDLPCLDNDDLRRGRPTHHKKFGEDMALLAGDGLLTLAFYTLAKFYGSHPRFGELVGSTSSLAGVQGMVGGQVLDMAWDDTSQDENLLKTIHELKTGALISLSVRGAALICQAPKPTFESLSRFGDLLGLAFQISDDVQDGREGEEGKNFFSLWGEAKTLAHLHAVSDQARAQLKDLGPRAEPLRALIQYNIDRL